MPVSSQFLQRSLLVGVLMISTATGAVALTVEKATMEIDGAFVPVLVVIDGSTTIVHKVGEDGLTRSILFDPKKALKWTKARYGADVDIDEDSFEDDGAATFGETDNDNDGGGASS